MADVRALRWVPVALLVAGVTIVTVALLLAHRADARAEALEQEVRALEDDADAAVTQRADLVEQQRQIVLLLDSVIENENDLLRIYRQLRRNVVATTGA